MSYGHNLLKLYSFNFCRFCLMNENLLANPETRINQRFPIVIYLNYDHL